MKHQTATSQIAIPQEWQDRFNNIYDMASGAADKPFEKWGTQASDFVARVNPEQKLGIANTNTAAGSWQPAMASATAATGAGAGSVGLGSLNVNKYMSPYIQNVADTTAAQMNQQFQQAQSGQMGDAIASGAFGGDRSGIAAAVLQGQQAMATGSTMSNIYNQGYGQALDTATQQQGADYAARAADKARALQVGQQYSNLASQNLNLGLQGANAQMQAGTLQQQTKQAGKDALIRQFMQEKGYPFQIAQFLANIGGSLGSLYGSTTTQTSPRSWFADGGAVGKDGGGGVAGPYGSAVGSMPEDAPGSWVPEGFLPVGDLLVADPNFIAQTSQSSADQLARSAAFGENLAKLDKNFGKNGAVFDVLSKLGLGGAQAEYAEGGVVKDIAPQPANAQGYMQSIMDAQTELKKQPLQQDGGAGGGGGGSKIGGLLSGVGSAASGMAALLPILGLSDPRAKHDAHRIGYTDKGLPIHSFKYKGDKSGQTHIGFMADEVVQRHPDAVGMRPDGFLGVDYSQAKHFAAGGGVGEGYMDGVAAAAPRHWNGSGTGQASQGLFDGSPESMNRLSAVLSAQHAAGGRVGYYDGGGIDPTSDMAGLGNDSGPMRAFPTGPGLNLEEAWKKKLADDLAYNRATETSALDHLDTTPRTEAQRTADYASGKLTSVGDALGNTALAAGQAGLGAIGGALSKGIGYGASALGATDFGQRTLDEGDAMFDAAKRAGSYLHDTFSPSASGDTGAGAGSPPPAGVNPVTGPVGGAAAGVAGATLTAGPAGGPLPAGVNPLTGPAGAPAAGVAAIGSLPARAGQPAPARPAMGGVAPAATATGAPGGVAPSGRTTPTGGMPTGGSDFYFGHVVPVESGGNQFDRNGQPLTSSAGAVGAGQIMPATGPEAARLAGLPWDENRFRTDKEYNLALGKAYFQHQLDTFGDPYVASAAYNAGPGAVQAAMARAAKEGGSYLDYLPKETRDYVAKVGGPVAENHGRVRPAYADRTQFGKLVYNPETNKVDKNFILSLLSGIGTMASSPSLNFGSAVLQGVGGAANTYAGLQRQAADIANIGAQTEQTKVSTDASRFFTVGPDGMPMFVVPGQHISIPLTEYLADPDKYRWGNPAEEAAALAEAKKRAGEAPTGSEPFAAPGTKAGDGGFWAMPATQSAMQNEQKSGTINWRGTQDASAKLESETRAAATAAYNAQTGMLRQTKAITDMLSPEADVRSGALGELKATAISYVNELLSAAGQPLISGPDDAQIAAKMAILSSMNMGGGAGYEQLATLMAAQPDVTKSPEANAEMMAGLLVNLRRSIDQYANMSDWKNRPDNKTQTVLQQPMAFNEVYGPEYAMEEPALKQFLLAAGTPPEGMTVTPMEAIGQMTDPAEVQALMVEVLKNSGYTGPVPDHLYRLIMGG